MSHEKSLALARNFSAIHIVCLSHMSQLVTHHESCINVVQLRGGSDERGPNF
jgi:hypothetical protein